MGCGSMISGGPVRAISPWTAENLPTIQNVLNHRSLAPTSIYARLNTKAVDRALQRQADRFFEIQEPAPAFVALGTERKRETVEVLDR